MNDGGSGRLKLDRRTFLRLWGLGFAGMAGNACVARRAENMAMGATPIPRASPAAPETPTRLSPPTQLSVAPTSTLTSTPTLCPTPTPIAEPLFDEGVLTPVYVAHDPDVQGYGLEAPFDPDFIYPEYPYPGDTVAGENGAYGLVRRALSMYEPKGFETNAWNPLASLVKPGGTVLIKPNLVDDALWERGKITHPAIIRAVVDFAYLACGSAGRIIVGDGPWAVGVFEGLVGRTGLRDMARHLAQEHGVPVELCDLDAVAAEETPQIDLGLLSALQGPDRRWYDGHGREMIAPGCYRISPVVLRADAVISVPKIKVHCSGGLTLNMKNMLGIIPAWDGYADGRMKDCAHTSDADRANGPRGEYLENDTIWRSMADLNRILLYADESGALRQEQQRSYLSIVDGIVAGEESQYEPRPRSLGTIIVGVDPISTDAVTARVAGFDPRRLRSITQPGDPGSHSLGSASACCLRISLSGAPSMQALCTDDRVIIPESRVYSWEGQVEVTDFEAPKLQWEWIGESGNLRVRAIDSSGVAYVRLRYERLGEERTRELALQAGTSRDGEWGLSLPAPEQVELLELIASDELYHVSCVPLIPQANQRRLT